MDDLDVNPLYKGFMTKFRREFDIACKMSYMIAIPHTNSLGNIVVDQFLASSHILIPSKLLKMHFIPLQAGYSDDIELEDRKLICHMGKKNPNNVLIANILAEEIGYNSQNKEYRTLLIDKPLMPIEGENNNYRNTTRIRGLLAPKSQSRHKVKPPNPIENHEDCLKYLEYISLETTFGLETDVRRLQSNYMILSDYLDDAAMRAKGLVEIYIPKFELALGGNCDSIRQTIRLSVENYVIYLLHGKLMASIQSRHSREDRILEEKFIVIQRSNLSICQLGAQSAFADFTLDEELIEELKRLSYLQSPLAFVSQLMRLVRLTTEALDQSVRFKQLIGGCEQDKVLICSDDLIACFVFSLARAKPAKLFSLSKYLDIFGWSSSAKDQAAYYTATFQIVIQYVFGYNYNGIKSDTVATCEDQLDNAMEGSGKPCDTSTLNNSSITSQFIDSVDSHGSTTLTDEPDSAISVTSVEMTHHHHNDYNPSIVWSELVRSSTTT